MVCKSLHLIVVKLNEATQWTISVCSMGFSKKVPFLFSSSEINGDLMLKGCGAGLRARGLVYFPARAPVPSIQCALRAPARPRPPCAHPARA